jgi:hypothetical protein
LQWKMLVCIFCGYLAYFVAIWHILRPFGIFCGHLVYLYLLYFPPFWYVVPRVNLATLLAPDQTVFCPYINRIFQWMRKCTTRSWMSGMMWHYWRHKKKTREVALLAWHSGHRVRLQNRRSRVRGSNPDRVEGF